MLGTEPISIRKRRRNTCINFLLLCTKLLPAWSKGHILTFPNWAGAQIGPHLHMDPHSHQQWEGGTSCLEALYLQKTSLLSCHTKVFKKENVQFQWNGIGRVFSFMCFFFFFPLRWRCSLQAFSLLAPCPFFFVNSILWWHSDCCNSVLLHGIWICLPFSGLPPPPLPLRGAGTELRIRIGIPWVLLVVTSPVWPRESNLASCHILNGRGADPLSRMAERVNTLMMALHFSRSQFIMLLSLTAETNVMIKDQWPLWNKLKPSEEH